MASDEQVMTVLGPVTADRLGVTLTHEHLLIDMTCYWQPSGEGDEFVDVPVGITNLGLLRRDPFAIRDNCLLTDIDLAIQEVTEFSKLGGGTIVDLTLADIGRDPAVLQMAARMTGLNIICGCGHYVYLAHPRTLTEETVESIAERLIGELSEGIEGTSVRPGIIGEIGTSDPVRPTEEKVLRAAARAQQHTGVAISLHLHPSSRNGHDVLDILESEGADLGRVVAGHLDISLGHLDIGVDEAVAYQRSIAERGCYVEFDCCGVELYQPGLGDKTPCWLPSDQMRAQAVVMLCDAGCGTQLLLSQDVCKKMDLIHYGGFGYGHVLRSFVHNLRDFGLDDNKIDHILIDNPRRMLVPVRS